MKRLTQEQLLLLTKPQLEEVVMSCWPEAVITHTFCTFFQADSSQSHEHCIDRVDYKKWKLYVIPSRGLSGDPDTVAVGVSQPQRTFNRWVLRKKLKPLIKYPSTRGIYRTDSVMVRMVVNGYNAEISDRFGLVLCYSVLQLLEHHNALETGEFSD